MITIVANEVKHLVGPLHLGDMVGKFIVIVILCERIKSHLLQLAAKITKKKVNCKNKVYTV